MKIFERKKFNKKGDLPVTILVIGVFGICTLALLSFISSSYRIGGDFNSIDLMEKANSQIENYYFYKREGLINDNILKILNIKIDENGKNYFYIGEKFSKGFLFSKKSNLKFSIEYPLS